MADAQPTPDIDAFMGRYAPAAQAPAAEEGLSPAESFMNRYAHNALISDKPADQNAPQNPLSAAFGVAKGVPGQAPGTWGKELTDEMRNVGILSDVQKQHETAFQAFNDAVIRPPLSAIMNLAQEQTNAIGTTVRSLASPTSPVGRLGVWGAIKEVPSEVQAWWRDMQAQGGENAKLWNDVFAGRRPPPKAGDPNDPLSTQMTNWASGLAFGETPRVRAGIVPTAVRPVPSLLAQARDLGVIGGTDAEYFGTQSPQFRVETDQVLAQAPPLKPVGEAQTVPDLNAAARRIAPEVFDRYDALEQRAATLRQWINDLSEQRASGTSPTLQGLETQINDLRAKQLQATGAAKRDIANQVIDLENQREKLVDTLKQPGDTPEMAKVRADLLTTRHEQMSLVPQRAEALRQAQAQGGIEPTPIAPEQPTTSEAATQKPTVIAPSVSRNLVAVGRPQEEADALGALAQAYYETRAARFGGRKGTAEELYAREAPEITGAEKTPAEGETEYAQSSFTVPEAQAAINDAIEAEYERNMASARMRFRRGTPEYEAASQRARAAAEDWINQPEGRAYLEQSQFAKDHPDYAASLRDYFARAYEGIAEGQPFHANVNRLGQLVYEQARRGKIAIREGRKVITLLKTADASTFIHETGHAWLEDLMKDAKDAQAPADLVADARTVRDWLGAEQGKAITRAQHEKFARGFERYMMEGIAPSRPLGRVFAQFKQWLTTIYRTVSRLRSPITDDIRGVFDRMLSEKPERTIYAPEREAAPNIAESAENAAENAANMPPVLAANEADRIRQQADEFLATNAPEIADELGLSTAATRAGEAESGVSDRGGNAGQPEPTGAAGGEARGAVGARGGEDETAGAGGNAGGEPPLRGGAGAGSGGERSPEARYNKFVRNLNTDADAEAIIRQIGHDNGEFIASKGGVITDQDVKNMAVSLAADPATLEARLRQNSDASGIPLAAYIKAAQIVLPQMARDVRAAMIVVAKEGSTDAELAEYVKAQERFITMMDAFTGVGSQQGRGLRAYHRVDSIDDWRFAEDLSEFFQGQTGRTPEELRTQAKVGAQLTEEAELARLTRQEKEAADAAKAKRKQQIKSGIISWLMNAVLSGPATHFMYAVGMRAYVSVYVGMVLPAAAAARRIAGETIGVHMEDAALASVAMSEGARYGLIGGRKALASGVPFFQGIEELKEFGEAAEPLMKKANYQFRKAIGALPGAVGYGLETPGRMISAIHTYSYSTYYEMYAAMLALRRARAEGFSVQKDEAAMGQRAAQIRQNLTMEETAEAHEAALDATLMRKSPFGSFTQRLTSLANTNVVTKGVLPFIQIQTNLLMKGLKEGDPLFMMMNEDVKSQLRGDQGRYAQDIARGRLALAAGITGAIFGLRASGFMTGAPPTDQKTAAEWRMLGIQPYSLQIAGGSYPLRKFLGPGAIPIVLAASYYDLARAALHGDVGRTASVAVAAAHEVLLNDLWLGNLVSMFEGIHNATTETSGGSALKYFENLGLSYAIPASAFWGQINHNFLFSLDPYRRDIDKNASEFDQFVQQAMARIPGLSRELNPQIDIFGRPVPYVAQMTPTNESRDPVDLALAHVHDTGPNKYWPEAVKRDFNGHKLTGRQYMEYATLAGKYAYQSIQGYLIEGRLQRLSPKGQENLVRSSFEDARKLARSRVLQGDYAVQQALGQVENSLISRSVAAKRAAIYGPPTLAQ